MTDQLAPGAVEFVNRLFYALQPSSPWIKEKVRMVFANPSHTDGAWSTPKEDGHGFTDCESDMLRGQITQLWHKREEDRTISWFLKMKCSDGYSYVIHSRHGRTFSRTMLGALSLMTVEEIQNEVILQCSPWKAEKGYLQFCNIYVTEGRKIEVPRIDSEALPAIAITAQLNVAKACGYEYTPPEQAELKPTTQEVAPAPDYDDIPF